MLPSVLKCPVCCDGQFQSRFELRRHLTNVASLLNSIRCSQCDEGFPSLLELADHLKSECVDEAGIPFKLKDCPVILVDCSGLSNDSTMSTDQQPVTTTAEALGKLLSKQPLTGKENVTEVRNRDRGTLSAINSKNLVRSTLPTNNSKQTSLQSTVSNSKQTSLQSTVSNNKQASLQSTVSNSKQTSLQSTVSNSKQTSLQSTVSNSKQTSLQSTVSNSKQTSLQSTVSNSKQTSLQSTVSNSKQASLQSTVSNNKQTSLQSTVSNSKQTSLQSTVSNSKQASLQSTVSNSKKTSLQSTAEKQPEPTDEPASKRMRILSQQELKMLLTTMKQQQTPVTPNQPITTEKSSIDQNKSNTVQLKPVKTYSRVTEIKAPLSTQNAGMSEKSIPIETMSKITGINTPLATSTIEKPTPMQTISKLTLVSRNSALVEKSTSIQTFSKISPLATNASTSGTATPIQTFSKVSGINTPLATNASTSGTATPIQTFSKVTGINTPPATNASTIGTATPIQTFSKVTGINTPLATRNVATGGTPTLISMTREMSALAGTTKTVNAIRTQHVLVNLDSDDDDDLGMDNTQDEPEIVDCFADSPIDDASTDVENEASNTATETMEKSQSSAKVQHDKIDVSKPSTGRLILLQKENQKVGTQMVTMNNLKKVYRTVPLLGENSKTPTNLQGPTQKVTQLHTANQENVAANGGPVSSTSSTNQNDDDCIVLDQVSRSSTATMHQVSGSSATTINPVSGSSTTTIKRPSSTKKLVALPKDKRITNIATDRPKLKYINIMHPEDGTLSKEKLRQGVTVDKIISTGFDIAQVTNVFFQCNKCKQLFDDLASAESHTCKLLQKMTIVSLAKVPTEAPKNWNQLHKLLELGLGISKRRFERELKDMDMTAERSVKCDECSLDVSPEVLELHKIIHTVGYPVLKCVECDFTTVINKRLEEHKRVTHPKLPKHPKPLKRPRGEKPLPPPVAIFVCEFCEQEFNSYNKVVRHRRLVHPIEEGQMKRFNCSYCGHAFKLKEDCNRHERIHTKEKPFSCDLCGKKFRISYSLGLHKRTHTGVRPYPCKECGKSFKSYSALAFHKKGVHSNVYDNQCNLCPKKFKTMVSLLNHKSTHEKRHKCNHCTRYFANRHTLGVHERKMHINRQRDSFVCIICKASYGRAWSLENHLKTHGYISENLACLKTMVDAGRISNDSGELIIPTSPTDSAPIKPPRRKKAK